MQMPQNDVQSQIDEHAGGVQMQRTYSGSVSFCKDAVTP